jgi:sulfatase maturation enzyme AslB (radical SAM superfamily)
MDSMTVKEFAGVPYRPSPPGPPGRSIESGYFVFTLMPSLFCHLRCPHCYLSLDERRDRTTLGTDLLVAACEKIDAYWDSRGIKDRTVICYWYGGEPTSMGVKTFREMADGINGVFRSERGYRVKHTVLTSLVSVRDEWFPVFDRYGAGEVQTSYDGVMRGAAYVRKWERRVRDAVASGLRVSTISVVNREILSAGAAATLDYLSDLGVAETSWLPFMWNEQNAGGSYDRYAPTMNEWSDFMMQVTERWMARRSAGLHVPEIGQMRFILGQAQRGELANIAAQTLFLMPNGDFVLPDYKDGWLEFMRPFGNIVTQDFGTILSSPARRAYLRRQVLRNGNAECLSCDHHDKCVMEFWKENRSGDDCFGGRRFVEWLLPQATAIEGLTGGPSAPTLY